MSRSRTRHGFGTRLLNQAGEIQAPQDGNTLAEQQGPAAESSPAVAAKSNGNSGTTGSSTAVLGATESFKTATTGTKDVVKAKGGVDKSATGSLNFFLAQLQVVGSSRSSTRR